jgi:hypothetical protein
LLGLITVGCSLPIEAISGKSLAQPTEEPNHRVQAICPTTWLRLHAFACCASSFDSGMVWAVSVSATRLRDRNPRV